MYDLLIKGGRVIDPAQTLDDNLDVAVSGDKIAMIASDIPAGQGDQVIDAGDKIVCPGLIDIHCHVYSIIKRLGVEPDDAGVRQGVTTVVDAGSAGQAIFDGFPDYVVPASRTRVFCFLYLGSSGLSIVPPLRDYKDLDLEATETTIENNLDIIKGIKLGLSGEVVNKDGIKVVEMAKKTAGKFGLPVMIHIGDRDEKVSATLTQECLSLMEAGDILSHVYTGMYGSILRQDGTVLPELKDAMERGVVLDVANSRINLSFEVARKAMAQGILPTTMSTDLTIGTVAGPVYGMTVTMSKFMSLGLDLEQIIAMSTINSARALLAEDTIGSLKPGLDADISVLELLSGTWRFEDSEKQTIEATRLLAPSMTIKSGQLIPAQPVAQPQSLK
ncbi:amidohydrolase/deacetylase family metallohydrolase [Thermodesulfobacteriota bacterium]